MDPKRWRLDGQLALVTGGSAGIGRAIARELLGFGADVLLAARDAAGLESARSELLEDFPEREISTCVGNSRLPLLRRLARNTSPGANGRPFLQMTNNTSNTSRPAAGYESPRGRTVAAAAGSGAAVVSSSLTASPIPPAA